MSILKNNIVNLWADEGQLWLEHLPHLIEQLAIYWDLSKVEPVENMSYHYVAKALHKNEVPVVIKIGCDKSLMQSEYATLTDFNGHGAIKVIDYHTDMNALLLEQAISGELLKDSLLESVDNTIESYAKVIQQLMVATQSNAQYPHVKQWCLAIDRINDDRVSQHFIDKAKELRDYLLSSVEQEYLCHGDLHLENILHHGDSWVCIDPKGIIGEMAFEAAAFDLLHPTEWQGSASLEAKIVSRITALANSLNIDKQRLLAWIYVRAVISAQWFIEDHGNPDEKLALISMLYPLLTKNYHKNNVCLTYDTIADWYDDHRCRDLIEKDYLEMICSHLEPGASVLDLGCGTGRPMAAYLVQQGYRVTGVDGSKAQLEKAKIYVPEMLTLCEDMRKLYLEKTFDCIIAWHSFFHLSKADQRSMFQVFDHHINPNGLLVFTSGGPEEDESWSDNGGEMLYHASLSENEYQQLLKQYQFDVLCHNVQDINCGGATVWIAKSNKSI